MAKYGLCGERLSHSYSEMIHKLLGDGDYRLLSMTKEEFYDFMKCREFYAVNVTIPYKTDALKLCDIVSEEAKEIGSVNTVVNRGGVLHGYNTDITGFRFMLRRSGIELCGKKVIILGTGGTSLTAVSACRMENARETVIVSRSGKVNYENVFEHCDSEIIINTTPVGMFPGNGRAPLDISRFPKLEGAADVIYNPKRTRLLLDAEKAGIKTAGGLSMLVAQAVEADRLFFDREKDEQREGETVEKIISKIDSDVCNIVLVGMPGCGKSTVGRILAEKLRRRFIDADDYICEKCGRTPADIISNDGEAVFRRIESEALEEITKLSATVIACGGGAVIKESNRELMRQNGVCVYIMRDLSKLDTNGRPLSAGGSDRLLKLFGEREPLYCAAADFKVDLEENAEACADKIAEICIAG